jgi:hypothetical protein
MVQGQRPQKKAMTPSFLGGMANANLPFGQTMPGGAAKTLLGT